MSSFSRAELSGLWHIMICWCFLLLFEVKVLEYCTYVWPHSCVCYISTHQLICQPFPHPWRSSDRSRRPGSRPSSWPSWWDHQAEELGCWWLGSTVCACNMGSRNSLHTYSRDIIMMKWGNQTGSKSAVTCMWAVLCMQLYFTRVHSHLFFLSLASADGMFSRQLGQ